MKYIFEDIRKEADAKLASMIEGYNKSESQLISYCEVNLPQDAVTINNTILYAKSLKSNNKLHPSLDVYFSHPLRVSIMSIKAIGKDKAGVETACVCLLHNVYEVCHLDEDDLAMAGYSDSVSKAIRLLTIDREKQEDGEYLKKYYGNIEHYSKELALIKCMDKLDNALGFEIQKKGAAKTKYLDLSLRHVVPIAHRISPEFGEYYEQVISYMQKAEVNHELLNKYNKIVESAH